MWRRHYWLLIAFEQVKRVISPRLCLVVRLKKNKQENLGFLQFFSILKIEILIFSFVFFFFFFKSNVDEAFFLMSITTNAIFSLINYYSPHY